MHNDTFITISDAVNLATIIGMAQRCAKVSWVQEGGRIANGHARSIDGGIVGDDNIANRSLRITTQGGMEVWLPLREIADMVGNGTFCEYDWS